MKRAIVAAVLISACATSQTFIRINQLGYLPRSTKVAVIVSKEEDLHLASFTIHNALNDERVYSAKSLRAFGRYGPFTQTYRLDFSTFRSRGGFYIRAGSVRSPNFRIDDDVYAGSADFLLQYMRQQRCGYNPFLKDSCHTRDGYVVYHPALDSSFVDVVGGWHDASDYLQYVTTSANAVFQMLFAYQHNPQAFGDHFDAKGDPVPNHIPDILDEAKWGLDWLVKMNPSKHIMFNQVADDRDHLGFRLPTQDTVDYGRGKERPVYFATGRPQGILKYQNRSTGLASTAGKFSSAFALGSLLLEPYYPEFASAIRQKSLDAYEVGLASPGVCQTAPCRAPYFYEEDNWRDDMQLAATQLAPLFKQERFTSDALRFGADEGVLPWMKADTARHYQWYPFVNLGHYYLANTKLRRTSRTFAALLRKGLEDLYQRGKSTPFLFGVPFIWCSNNYVSATLTQIRLYERTTGDPRYREMEASLRDWMFGCNPWGTSMVVGLPKYGVSPKDPHSAFTHLYKYEVSGGLVDGPVRGSIFSSLKGIHLSKADAFAEFQSDVAVYHDDWGDYSTNEPTMDGTASLTYYLSGLEVEGGVQGGNKRMEHGGITRMDSTRKDIYLVFTGHEFADGAATIRRTLNRHRVKASFFFTGDFYRNPDFSNLIRQLKAEKHFLGGHSDKHLLYAPWEQRDSVLVTKDSFVVDLKMNYAAMKKFGIHRPKYFLPPYEWYNKAISEWSSELGLTLVNFTPGTSSNADYTTPDMKNYLGSDSLVARILRYESNHGMNGFILLSHIGTSPLRTDKFYDKLDGVITELARRGYRFQSL